MLMVQDRAMETPSPVEILIVNQNHFGSRMKAKLTAIHPPIEKLNSG